MLVAAELSLAAMLNGPPLVLWGAAIWKFGMRVRQLRIQVASACAGPEPQGL